MTSVFVFKNSSSLKAAGLFPDQQQNSPPVSFVLPSIWPSWKHELCTNDKSTRWRQSKRLNCETCNSGIATAKWKSENLPVWAKGRERFGPAPTLLPSLLLICVPSDGGRSADNKNNSKTIAAKQIDGRTRSPGASSLACVRFAELRKQRKPSWLEFDHHFIVIRRRNVNGTERGERCWRVAVGNACAIYRPSTVAALFYLDSLRLAAAVAAPPRTKLTAWMMDAPSPSHPHLHFSAFLF